MNQKLWPLFLSLFLISCAPPEEPSDTDETNDSDTPVTDIDPNEQINFPDSVLRACVEKLIYGKNPGDPIYTKDVANITEIHCNGVSDLTGMQYLQDLEFVELYDSHFNSLVPLANLFSIIALHVEGGGVKNLSDINMLSNLVSVLYKDSDLEDISALAGKENLTTANIYGNQVKSLAALASLPSLEKIDASDNPTLTTLGAQFTAPKLTELNISNCGLTSLNELSGLPELASIDAGDNYITDTAFIATLSKLSSLTLQGNCLEGDQLQTYVDWWNKEHPDFPTTYEQELSNQSLSQCQ